MQTRSDAAKAERPTSFTRSFRPSSSKSSLSPKEYPIPNAMPSPTTAPATSEAPNRNQAEKRCVPRGLISRGHRQHGATGRKTRLSAIPGNMVSVKYTPAAIARIVRQRVYRSSPSYRTARAPP
eukprot:scaffold304_cov248-Pinguiococcus_pyrenoidosus.AAC.5